MSDVRVILKSTKSNYTYSRDEKRYEVAAVATALFVAENISKEMEKYDLQLLTHSTATQSTQYKCQRIYKLHTEMKNRSHLHIDMYE